MRIGIFGPPQAGKSTLFRVLTQGQSGTTRQEGPITLTTAVVPLPDPRLDRLYQLVGAQRKVPASFTLVDFAGSARLEPDRPLGPLRNLLAQMDALVLVVRAFPADHIPHPWGEVDPQRDIQQVEQELLLYDLETVERRLERLQEEWQKAARPREQIEREQALFRKLAQALQEETPLRALELSRNEERLLQGFTLLTRKPLLVVVNVGEGPWPSVQAPPAARVEVVALQLEEELAQLTPEEAQEFRQAYQLPPQSARERLLRALMETLAYIVFYTFNEREARAWLLPQGSTAVQAAGRIHSDMAQGFIRAEVVPIEAFLQAEGDRETLRRQAAWHLEGREYQVQDGDILYIRFQRRGG